MPASAMQAGGVAISAPTIDRYAAELVRLGRAGGAAGDHCTVRGADRQDGRAMMFMHPALSCRVLAHDERRQASKRAANFWNQIRGRPA